jgi:hypothetical protein
MIASLMTTVWPADAQNIGFLFSNIASARSCSGMRSAELGVGLLSQREEENCRLIFGAFARVAAEFSVLRHFTSPNQALEHNAIALHFLFCHVDHGVAHL